jgi:hypothetical protein
MATEEPKKTLDELIESTDDQQEKNLLGKIFGTYESTEGPVTIVMEHKYSDDVPLTPEQLQAQQDAYDQWTAPSVEPVDFEAERNAYLDRRQIREEIVDDGSIRMTNVVVGEDSDGNFTVTGEIDL